MKKLTNIFVSLFYLGYIRRWPGTIASFASIIFFFGIYRIDILGTEILIIFFVLTFIVSLYFINKFSHFTKTQDSGIIVIDEFLGIFFIFIFFDYIYFMNEFLTFLLIFIFFRFFDILKIFPANLIDRRMKNSLGVLLDDLVASIYTIISLYILNVYS